VTALFWWVVLGTPGRGLGAAIEGLSAPLSMPFFAQRVEKSRLAQNQSDRLAPRLQCPRSDTGGFRSAPNLWKVRASAGAAGVASMARPAEARRAKAEEGGRDSNEANSSAIVEEVRRRRDVDGPSARGYRQSGLSDEGERRQHCLRGMKPQGPGVFGES
jgi:hypothetical protein